MQVASPYLQYVKQKTRQSRPIYVTRYYYLDIIPFARNIYIWRAGLLEFLGAVRETAE